MNTLLSFIFLFFPHLARSAEVVDCPDGQYRVRAHSRRAHYRTDGTFVKASKVRASCKTKSRAYEFWNDRLKSGSPKDWPHRSEERSEWTTEQRERVIEALEDVPELLWVNSIEGIYRLKKSKDHPNQAAHGTDGKRGMIVLYDNAFDGKTPLSRILVHELSHELYRTLPEKDGASYRRATGWTLVVEEDGSIIRAPRKKGFVKDDGSSSSDEDFANNMDHFLFEPEKLKLVTPSAYDWIKDRFGSSLKMKGRP